MNAPCHGCEERVPGCHAECRKYKAYHEERLNILKQRRAQITKRVEIESYKRKK